MIDLLVVNHSFPPRRGGVERFLDGLARSVAPGSTVVVTERARGHVDAEPYEVRRRTLIGPVPPRWSAAALAIARAPRARVTLCGEWWPAARALAVLPRRHAAVLVHGTEIVRSLRPGGPRRSLETALARCDVVLANSRFTASLLAPIGIEAQVLNPGVDLALPTTGSEAVAEALGVAGSPIVLTTARLVARKGHADLFATWPIIRRAHPDAVWLVVGDGPERARLEATAPDGVRLLGTVDDATLGALYRLADVHVLPGREVDGDVEGFGMAAVEAGAAGTPTVATDLGGTAEAVGAGGVVVPTGDAHALAEAVADLLTDGTRLAQLASMARARAEELAWPRVAARFRALVGL